METAVKLLYDDDMAVSPNVQDTPKREYSFLLFVCSFISKYIFMCCYSKIFWQFSSKGPYRMANVFRSCRLWLFAWSLVVMTARFCIQTPWNKSRLYLHFKIGKSHVMYLEDSYSSVHEVRPTNGLISPMTVSVQ